MALRNPHHSTAANRSHQVRFPAINHPSCFAFDYILRIDDSLLIVHFQPSDGISTVLVGCQITNEEAESLDKKK